MAINKKLIHFNTFENFNSKKLSANIENTQYTLGVDGEIQTGSPDILYQSIVYIKDTKQQWTHGQLYDGSTFDPSSKQDIITDLESIRQGAAKGATALQSYTEQYKGTVTGVKVNGTTKSPSNGVVDLGTVITSHQDISGKQDTLVSGSNIKTINGTSILGSGDIVISSGSSSSGSGAYALIEHDTNDTTYTLTPNTFHVWGEVGSLTLTFGEEQSGVANEYLFQFESGETATTLTLPNNLIWANDDTPVIESNYTYQVSILKGLAAIMKFKKKTNLIENKLTVTNGSINSTFTFEYPVASDVSVTFTSDFGDTDIITIYSGSMSGKTDPTPGYNSLTNNNIEYITPEKDSVYIYTF